MKQTTQKLIKQAQKIMSRSSDPVHDIKHVQCVVENVKKISNDINISEQNKKALILAAWWHDAGRTITKKPSIIWMVMIDDIISAFMLLGHSLCFGLWNRTVWQASKIILCKGFRADNFLTRILLKKKTKLLLNILCDADIIEVLNQERINFFLPLIKNSKLSLASYKFLTNRNLKINKLKIKTEAARKYFEEIIKKLLQWAKQTEIIKWHIENFGKEWYDKIKKRIEDLLDYITLLNLQTNHTI